MTFSRLEKPPINLDQIEGSNCMERWRHIPTAVIADMVENSHIDSAIRPLRPFGQQPHLFGTAITVSCEPANIGALIYALDLITPGQVLVIDAGASRDVGMIGGILCGYARQRGAVGVVCDGAVRDTAETGSWDDFSVFARSIAAKGPAVASGGAINVPVSIGGRTVSPGDLVVGDDDGLAVLRVEQLDLFIEAAEAKLAKEQIWIGSLKSGISARETFGLPKLDN
ncbi:dimethylmenaquinone methyltransferase (plasmid) [Sinorhizobium medicae]|uniref:RraA family protein n=1 Tax=Sinorhizobium medicae TaxID=110321 RepID=UPI001F438456|nr:dimethylmenaquinone methyltransferase [Sinorhizobium medicae]WQO54962.1 dimethylmenaquinone methyltransferase [Sinorhizobium medicae]